MSKHIDMLETQKLRDMQSIVFSFNFSYPWTMKSNLSLPILKVVGTKDSLD